MYANLDLTSTDLTSNSELTQTYEFNRDLTLVQGRYSVYLRDFIFGADLDAIAPGTITPSVYGDYLDFDILSLANVAIGLGFRYIYIGGKVFRSQIPPSFPTQSYATASCEISDTVINFDIVDQNVSNRFSTKYAPLAGEVVSARIGYVDLGSLGLINIPRDGFPDSLITATGWALRADTADMSVSFVAPVIQADVPSRPDIFVSDRYPQPVSQ